MEVRAEMDMARSALEALVDFNNAVAWARNPWRFEKICCSVPGTITDHVVMLLASDTESVMRPLSVLFDCQCELSNSWGDEFEEICTELRQLRNDYVLGLCEFAVPILGGARKHILTMDDVTDYKRHISALYNVGPDSGRYGEFSDRLDDVFERAKACIFGHIQRLDREMVRLDAGTGDLDED